uniref:Phospholipase A2 inhibitor n=1 Tax=Bothrops jararacussu TaxID=8726 RepID=A8I4M7_BOTJR|nr:gamma-phospholipase A2 inhibitor [Bothrops jararacussu]
MKSLHTICLLFIFVARGNSRSCDFCHNIGKDCDGYEQECSSPEDVCGKVFLEIPSASLSVRTVHKNCFSSSICKLGQIDVNIGHHSYIRGRINCCEKEPCEDQPFPGLPLSRPNGYYCPGALGLFTEDSTEYEAICHGTETKCIDIVGHRYENFPGDITYNLKGCVSSCPLLSLSNATREENRNYLQKVECKDAIRLASL